MKFKSYKKEKGFTLIETLLYISITSIMFLSITSFVIFMKDVEKDADIKWSLEREARKIVTVFENEINNSNEIDSPDSGDSDDSISLVTIPSDDIVSISLNGDFLELDKNPFVDQITSDKITVTDFVVDNLSDNKTPENIRLSFTLSAETSDGKIYSEIFYSSFTLRDYE